MHQSFVVRAGYLNQTIINRISGRGWRRMQREISLVRMTLINLRATEAGVLKSLPTAWPAKTRQIHSLASVRLVDKLSIVSVPGMRRLEPASYPDLHAKFQPADATRRGVARRERGAPCERHKSGDVTDRIVPSRGQREGQTRQRIPEMDSTISL